MNNNSQAQPIFEMFFVKVFLQQSHQQITIQYQIHENTSKQNTHGTVAFENLKKAFQTLKDSQEIKIQYPGLFSKIEFSKTVVKHIIDTTNYEVMIIDNFQKNQENEINLYNSLMKQMFNFFQQDLFICSYNFNLILKNKYSNDYQNKYSFMIFPGLISFDDSSQRKNNLQDGLKRLVRQQIFHITSKRLEILTFMKNFVIQKFESKFSQLSEKEKFFDEDIELLAKENIFLNTKTEDKIYCTFTLAYDVNKNLDYEYIQNDQKIIEKYQEGNIIQYTFQLEFNQKLLNLLPDIYEFLAIDNVQMQSKREINKYVKKVIEQKELIEKAFQIFYDEDYKNEDKLQKNFQSLESEIQKYVQMINNEQLEVPDREQRKNQIAQMREDMKKYRESMLDQIKFQKQIYENQ